MTCNCGNPDEPGIHWETGDCCPLGCECQDCKHWYPYLNIKLEERNLEEEG